MLEKLSDNQIKVINEIIKIGLDNGWNKLYTPNLYMLSFKKENQRINIYTTTMTISTAINHPIKGKTQLYRRNIDLKNLEKIFQNPRIHTKKGYYRKEEIKCR